MTTKSFQEMRTEIILRNKNGINFILAASICWLGISFLWTSRLSSGELVLYSFMATMPLLPLAWLLGKVFKTEWKIANNPLNDLGLWLNFAQLFYFPLLFFVLMRDNYDMPMALAIITGAHFFPYAWFYQTKSYAVMAGVISVGSAYIGYQGNEHAGHWIGAFVAVCLWILGIWLYADYKRFKSAKR